MLGNDESAEVATQMPSTKHRDFRQETFDELRTAVQEHDWDWAIRMLAEYSDGLARQRFSAPRTAPDIPRPWLTALAAITIWASQRLGQPAPRWVADIPAEIPAWSPVDASMRLSPEARDWIREHTPDAFLNKGILYDARSLFNA
jgi:hypothetical protein